MFNSIQFIFFIIGLSASIVLAYMLFSQFLQRDPKKPLSHTSVHLKQNVQTIHPKQVITPFESKMFKQLEQAFPEYYLLAQVAFSALITHDDMKIRNLFNRKVTDFVLLDTHFEVVAIIELDDRSHIGREKQDAERDAMLHEAGYQIFRFTNIPSTQQLRKKILKS